MTKELSAKRKVDKCRDMHPRAKCGGGEEADQWGGAARTAGAAIGPPGGANPAPPRGSPLLN